MVLGIYWYYGFPEGLYSFEHFKWLPGYGGHASNPAKLECVVEAPAPDRLLQRLHQLIADFEEGHIIVYRQGNILEISTGSFHLYDYDFLLMKKVEAILNEEKVAISGQIDRRSAELIRVFSRKVHPQTYPVKKLLQMVSSEKNKCNAESAMLRLDCFVPVLQKADFIAALSRLATEEQIEVLFYKEHAFETGINLMLFFGNGRQGLDLKPLKRIDIERLEEKAEAALVAHNGTVKHRGGWDFYPTGDPVVVKMIDGEFIL